jgi:hypothetical protein
MVLGSIQGAPKSGMKDSQRQAMRPLSSGSVWCGNRV